MQNLKPKNPDLQFVSAILPYCVRIRIASEFIRSCLWIKLFNNYGIHGAQAYMSECISQQFYLGFFPGARPQQHRKKVWGEESNGFVATVSYHVSATTFVLCRFEISRMVLPRRITTPHNFQSIVLDIFCAALV